MRRIFNTILSNVYVHIAKSQWRAEIRVQFKLATHGYGEQYTLELSELKKILDRLPLKVVHKPGCYYKRLVLGEDNADDVANKSVD